jgi:hypothetical protein
MLPIKTNAIRSYGNQMTLDARVKIAASRRQLKMATACALRKALFENG